MPGARSHNDQLVVPFFIKEEIKEILLGVNDYTQVSNFYIWLLELLASINKRLSKTLRLLGISTSRMRKARNSEGGIRIAYTYATSTPVARASRR
jgi:hypothetical protein